ncbi:unnamed protein product [marine sediment metagenome]|uniref:Uncharacterized protein n=1 Tax=marine sediment metagenome TaxID=412755 RepID=X1UNZ2_9ZZZZ
MNFIKKVFDKEIDDSVHLQFQKFSKGEFRDRALIKAKNSGGKYTINTSAEFANDMVRAVAEKLGDDITNIEGCVVSTNDLTGELDFQDKKQFQGVKKYMIDKEMSGNKILSLLEKFPKAFFALSFEAGKDNTILKIKPKAPKSGKPSPKSDKKISPNFCKLKTTDKEIGKSFIFEKPNFKEANITHDFIIEELILPEGEKDFAKIRELAKRKGKIIRKAE